MIYEIEYLFKLNIKYFIWKSNIIDAKWFLNESEKDRISRSYVTAIKSFKYPINQLKPFIKTELIRLLRKSSILLNKLKSLNYRLSKQLRYKYIRNNVPKNKEENPSLPSLKFYQQLY